MFYVVDEAQNPAPPGMLVTVTDPGGNAQSGYTIVGGAVPAITLAASTQYALTFYAERGPSSSAQFTTPVTDTTFALDTDGGLDVGGFLDDTPLPANTLPQNYFVAASYGDTTVLVVGYRSPYLSQSGASAFQATMFPLERAAPGAPNTANLQAGVAGGIASIDAQIQAVHGALRLQSSSGAAIDSWAADFLGPQTIPRQPNENDVAYTARVLQWLMLPFGTLAGIETAAQSFLATVPLNVLLGPIAGDTAGAADTAGGADGGTLASASEVVPKITVFDCQSNPALAAQVGLVATDAQFCVLFVFPNAASLKNWALNSSFLGSTTFLAAAAYYTLSACPSPLLDALIRIVKPGGSQPVYVANHPSE